MVGGELVLARNFAMTNIFNPNLADQLQSPIIFMDTM